MSIPLWKRNVQFVLVEPRESGNIGASARAMKNMGFGSLCLVNPPDPLGDEALWLAHNAREILADASTHPSLERALTGAAVVVGTSRRTGRQRGLILPIEEGARRINALAQRNAVALLFGREDRGLYNDEIEQCGFLVHIPADRKQPSLNLAQAVLLVAYELDKVGRSHGKNDDTPYKSPELVPQEQIGHFYRRMAHTLHLLGYFPRGDRRLEHKILKNLKFFIGRAGLTEWELHMLMGICTQIEKKLGDEKSDSIK
ncbi:MAG TPA: RNA methyltransferase [Dissulfurispiraceae bacterium]|nr:RNA methyltransferase [Dissulfurispiraceae bacterium]